ncbi:TrmH family RNA methyltransferase [Caminicella sporogenes]|uniref:TrmH family RNA methyltransferase n=1 Tax=Caminicella sporogenes TaxID=166485 RepID=UPI00254047CC|nr:RNA methyltransferase [Caminicella sporogenes]WIF94272.1 RNA methyltransferase [Caminicella sporogenes]
MTLEITSPNNKHVKHIKSLQIKKYRDKYGEFIIEGLRIIRHSLENNVELLAVYYSENMKDFEILKTISEKNINIFKIDSKIMKQISTTENSQGIIGIVKKKFYDLEDFMDKDEISIAILDRLQNPGNVGTIIRTADAAGFDAVVMIKGCVDIYNSKTIRATMGSIFTMPIIYAHDIDELIYKLKTNGIDIISTVLSAEKYHNEVVYKKKNAVIIGNEGSGISKEFIEKSNIKVKIPMLGNAESLNASVAAGIIMYEIVRQKFNFKNSKN